MLYRWQDEHRVVCRYIKLANYASVNLIIPLNHKIHYSFFKYSIPSSHKTSARHYVIYQLEALLLHFLTPVLDGSEWVWTFLEQKRL
jgi:hypothetical protein